MRARVRVCMQLERKKGTGRGEETTSPNSLTRTHARSIDRSCWQPFCACSQNRHSYPGKVLPVIRSTDNSRVIAFAVLHAIKVSTEVTSTDLDFRIQSRLLPFYATSETIGRPTPLDNKFHTRYPSVVHPVQSRSKALRSRSPLTTARPRDL